MRRCLRFELASRRRRPTRELPERPPQRQREPGPEPGSGQPAHAASDAGAPRRGGRS